MDKYISENKGIIGNKNLIIKEIADNFFQISFLEPKNPDKTSFAIYVDFPGFQIFEFHDILDINNFIKYYFEIKEKRKDNIINNS